MGGLYRAVPVGVRRWLIAGAAAALLASLVYVTIELPAARSGPQPAQLLASPPVSQPAVSAPQGKYAAVGLAQSKPTQVEEIVADRTAQTSTWRDSDGSLTVHTYAVPHFYQTSGGGYAPIDSSLSPVPGKPGWWQSGANSWRVAFGPAGAAAGMEQFTVDGRGFAFAPQGVVDADQAPSLSGDSVTYYGIWPKVDLADHVSAAGSQEDLVLRGPDAQASFSFALSGASAVANQSGGLDLLVDGQRVGSIPAPTVRTSAKQTGDPTVAAQARLTVSGNVVRVSVSPRWLAALPASAFPVVVDPYFAATAQPTLEYSVDSFGHSISGVVHIGQDSAGTNWRSEVFLPAPTLPTVPPGGLPWQFAWASFNATSDSNLLNTPVYGLSGYTTYGGLSGQPLFVQTEGGPYVSALSRGDQTIFTYLKNRGTSGWWFGFGTPSQVGPRPDGGHLATFAASDIELDLVYEQQVPATTLTSPANRSVVSTATPTLTAAPETDPSQSDYDYDFQILSSLDGTGVVVDSGWMTDQTSWTVPAGSLHDGVTYWARVQTSIDSWIDVLNPGATTPTGSQPIAFTVKERLGTGGSSPTDTVGSPPSGTTSPAKGAPSPGESPSSETVNLLTGDLSVAVGTPSMQTVAGPAGVTLSYDSAKASVSKGGNYGLTGQYYSDSGAHTFTGPLVGQRNDASVNAKWNGADAPIGGLSAFSAQFLVRWTGAVTLPAGTWSFGGLSTGGMRVYVNGSTTPTYDDWAGTASTTNPGFGSGTLAGGQQYQIEVDAWMSTAINKQDWVQLWAKNRAITDQNVVSSWVVPSNWLTPIATGVPAGWSLLANAASVQWVHADDQGSQVVLQGAGGQTATFTRFPAEWDNVYGGYLTSVQYQSPPGNHDLMNTDGNGHLQLATADNQLYTFNPDGSLASMTTVNDDLHPAALQYTYSGTPALLRSITDPVSGRSVSLSYGGDSACPSASPAAPGGMLCKIAYWDGTATTFGYNGNGQIASATSPGNQTTLLGYDSDNRLADIRDGLAADYVAAGNSAGTGVACAAGTTGVSVTPVDTQICYDGNGRVAKIVQPAPTSGAARPARTYTYASGHTDMSIAGFSPSSGYASRTSYDAQGRITQQTDSVGHTSTNVWGSATADGSWCSSVTTCGGDEPLATANSAGEQTISVFDAKGHVTDSYGPAPLACFSGGWPSGITPTAPIVGYLPVPNPQSAPGCGVATIPHTQNGYDEGINGLAATYWSNGQAAGPATMHANGLGGTMPPTLCRNQTDGICAHWDPGAPPVASDASGHWSLRLTGKITIPYDNRGATDVDFTLYTSQKASFSIDGGVVLSYDPSRNNGTPGRTVDISPGGDNGFGFIPYTTHTIQIDFQGSATQLNELAIVWGGDSNSPPWTTTIPPGILPNSVLSPAYGLKTSITDPGGVTTTTSYSDATVGPQYGLVTAVTVGAGGSTPLTSHTAYEPPSSSTYLRKISRTLPAGNANTYTYYGGTAGPLAAVCGVAANTPQGGMLQAATDPAPAVGAAVRVQQFVYDAAGRQVGRRVGTSTSITSVPWQCTTYDSRGRIATESWPAFNGAPARTVTYTYSIGGNPLVSSVSDTNGTITSTVDLLGRVTSYRDVQGQQTTTSYDQAGRVASTTGPGGVLTNGYDPNSSNLTTLNLGGTTLATAHYDGVGRLSTVDYANGTTGTLGYGTLGDQNSLVFTNTASGALVTGDQVTRSTGGRITSERENINGTSLTNPNPAGASAATYTYDDAGRLVFAYRPDGTAAYGYANNPAQDGCGVPAAGMNTNRTRITVTPTSGAATTIDYCYNGADQLTSTVIGTTSNTQYQYDDHGNQTNDNGTILTWDATDRLASSRTPSGVTTTYTYDALDRVVTRSTGSTTTGYWYSGYSDSPAGTLDAANHLSQQFLALPGSAMVTVQNSGNIWSYPDLHGNTTVTTDGSGIRQGAPRTYDAWGQLTTGSQPVDNATGGSDLGAFATAGKVTDTASGITILGARAYMAAEGRFLSVDPVTGGCANGYVYAFGDPLTQSDLTGKAACGTHFSFGNEYGTITGTLSMDPDYIYRLSFSYSINKGDLPFDTVNAGAAWSSAVITTNGRTTWRSECFSSAGCGDPGDRSGVPAGYATNAGSSSAASGVRTLTISVDWMALYFDDAPMWGFDWDWDPATGKFKYGPVDIFAGRQAVITGSCTL